MASPMGRHDEELQLLLGGMRSNRQIPRLVLLVVEPERAWRLAEVSLKRGEPPRPISGDVFTDREQAERVVFDMRWEWLSREEEHDNG